MVNTDVQMLAAKAPLILRQPGRAQEGERYFNSPGHPWGTNDLLGHPNLWRRGASGKV